MPRADEIHRWGALRGVDPGVIGGLVVERAQAARDAETDRLAMPYSVLRGVEAGLDAAARGQRRAERCTELPGWLRTALRGLVAEGARETLVSPFATIRTLELAGLLDLAPDDDYVLCMVAGLSAAFEWRPAPDPVPRPVRWVAADPGLVDKAIWRLFEVEGGGSVSLTNLDDYAPSWQPAFLTWVQDGTLSRARVLDASLRALSLDFAAFRARWYAGLLDALQPTPAELAERQEALRALLRSDVAPTVKLGVRHLRGLEKAQLLDAPATAPALVPAVGLKVKGTALDALRLLASIHRREPAADITTAAREGLGHEAPEVQRAAAALLQKAGAAGLVAEDAELLAPSVRRELGLDAAVEVVHAVAPSTWAPPVELPSLRPVGEDLLERLAAVLEDPSDAIELELVLDGLARLGDGSALQPLLKRARARLADHERDPDCLHDQLAGVVVTAGGGEPKHGLSKLPSMRFLQLRLLQVQRLLTGREARPLLATPDDPAGFVSPRALIERLDAWGGEVVSVDLIAGLLRLGVEGREEALTSLTVGGEVGEVVRHALGAPPADPSRVRTAEWWVAASRARAPMAEDALLIERGLSGAGQGRPIAASVSLEKSRVGSWRPETFWIPLTVVDHPVRVKGRVFGDPSGAPAIQPTATGEQRRQKGFGSWRPCARRWLATTWPHDAEHFLVDGIGALVGGAQSTSWDPDARAVLDALALHPGRLGSLAATAAALGLTQTSAEDRLRAVDWVAEMVPRGRLVAQDLAAAMAVTRELAVATRWAGSLRGVASAGAAPAVIDVLSHLLPQLDRGHHGLHGLLDVLHEELLRSGRRPTEPDLRAWLGGFSGASKASRTAKALLAL